MRNFAIIILFLAAVFHPSRVHALIDPARAAAIDVASELEKKALNAQYKVQMLQSTGHIWTRQEVDAVTDFQKEFKEEQHLHEGVEVRRGRGDGCPSVHDEHQGKSYGGTEDEDTGQNQTKAQTAGQRD